MRRHVFGMGGATRNRLLARQRAGLAIHGAAVAALVPAYLYLAPPSHWDDPVVLLVLGALAVVSDRHGVPLPSGVSFDALMALMLLTVALAGPLPAMEIILLPWAANLLTGRDRLRPGALADLAGYGWQAIAAALLIRAAGVDDPGSIDALGGLIAGGLAIYVVGWAVAPAVYGTCWLGHPFRALCRSFVDMAPAGAVMILLGAVTVVLTAPLGLAALALFAAIAVLPQSFLTYAARTRPVARLDRGTATRRYVHAIAVQLDLSRAERKHLAAVAAIANARPATGDAIDYAQATMRDRSPANYDAQLVTEWWNGRGGPIGILGESIPLAARVLAVAQTWAALTARGTLALGHAEALSHLREAAGARLDPRVVQAVQDVIAQERVTAAEPAPEPRLHRLRIPAPLRRVIAAG
jgi:hypothetical protein